MYSNAYPAVLDACVLVPYGLCDLLLRLAEVPSLYAPKWSPDILNEAQRALRLRLERRGVQNPLDAEWRAALEQHFPEAMIEGYEKLIELCENDSKDRHVLAAAAKECVGTIVTSNVKDFPVASLRPWNVEVVRPGDFLISLYELAPDVVTAKLDDIGTKKERTRQENLTYFYKVVPNFAQYVADAHGITLLL